MLLSFSPAMLIRPSLVMYTCANSARSATCSDVTAESDCLAGQRRHQLRLDGLRERTGLASLLQSIAALQVRQPAPIDRSWRVPERRPRRIARSGQNRRWGDGGGKSEGRTRTAGEREHADLRLDVAPLAGRLEADEQVVQALAHRNDPVGHLFHFRQPERVEVWRRQDGLYELGATGSVSLLLVDIWLLSARTRRRPPKPSERQK